MLFQEKEQGICVFYLTERGTGDILYRCFFKDKSKFVEAISKVIQKMAKMASQRAAKGSLKLLPVGNS